VNTPAQAAPSPTATRQDPCEGCGFEGAFDRKFPELSIVKCPRCELVFYNGAVNTKEIYVEGYFTGGEYFDYLADHEVQRRNFRDRLENLQSYCKGGALLEVGCAYGLFLDVARHTYSVRGYDVVPEAVSHAKLALGLDARCGDFLDVPDEPESVDVICLWDTIEHLQHPARYVEKAARWLKRGGILVITTGDVGSAVARLRGSKWRQVHPPSHLFYFSGKTLGGICERAGLQVQNKSWPGYYRSTRAMVHNLLLRLSPRLGERARSSSVLGEIDLPIYLNLFDIIQVVARKP
jgi:SAM-dependent methyltransferase